MKIQGKTFSGPATVPVVIPRPDGDIVIKCQSVLDFDEFEALVPTPEPPEVLRPGGIKTTDPTDKKYQKALDDYSVLRTNWMILKSLEATKGLEWDTVVMSDPKTWDNFRSEMTASGFSPVESGRIILAVTEACGLNQEKIDEATERFLAEEAAANAEESSLRQEL